MKNFAEKILSQLDVILEMDNIEAASIIATDHPTDDFIDKIIALNK